jgi:pimeloyl-ACP methyl ester carboxylesterase
MTADKPVLAFAHANGVPGGSYRKFLAAFEQEYQVHAVDRLGHDPAFPVDGHWQSLSRELEAFLAPLPKPLVGMGHSMGGVLMFTVAARRPEWFSALIMLDPPLINGWQRWLFNLARWVGQGDRLSPAGKSKFRRASWPNRAEVEGYFSRRGFFQRFDPDCLRDYIDAAVECDEEGCRLRYRVDVEVAIFRETPRNLHSYPRLAVPGMLFNGTESEPMFLACAKRHAASHKMAWGLAEGGHMFPLEKPEQNGALILRHLRELRS